jgi:capsular polysaccharide biosynthesis protein
LQLAQIIRRTSALVWTLALIPALALATLMFLVTFTPSTYRVVGTIGVTTPTGSDTAASITQTVDSFRSALTTQAVLDETAEDVGLDRVREQDISSSRVGVSNFVDVEVRADDPDLLEPLVLALMENANDLLFAPAINAAEAQEDSAQEDFDAVQTQIEETSTEGVTIPVEKYRAKASEVTQLRVALAAARARGTGEANALQESLTEASGRLTTLSSQVRELEELAFQLDRARTRLSDTSSVVSATAARLVAAKEPTSAELGSIVEQSQQTVLLRAIVAGLVVGIAVALGFVLLVGALRRGDPESRGRRAG